MFNRRCGLQPSVLFVALALGLSGCGGGGGGGGVNVRPAPPTPSPPASGNTRGDEIVEVGGIFRVGSGESIPKRILLGREALLDNAGMIGGEVDIAVQSRAGYDGAGATIHNHDGGTIKGRIAGIDLHATINVKNESGGQIEGGSIGIEMGDGGALVNTGVDTLVRSTKGVAIKVTGRSGDLENLDGASIIGKSNAIHLEYGGTIFNGPDSTIATTGKTTGNCAKEGSCSIFIASDAETPTSSGSDLTLVNAGLIIGNIQTIHDASNAVTLLPGGSIHGDIDIGTYGSSLELGGDIDTTVLYSQAVTGTTTFNGYMHKVGDGTWIIDKELTPDSITVTEGTLQIGNGGTTGSVGSANIFIPHGTLVFNRSDDFIFEGSISKGHSEAYDGRLVQAGIGNLILTDHEISPESITIQRGSLQFDNTGEDSLDYRGNYYVETKIENNGALIFDSKFAIFCGCGISGTGSLTKNASGELFLYGTNTYSGDTTINDGILLTLLELPGDVVVNQAGTLGGYSGATLTPGLPGVAGHLLNAGKTIIRQGDSLIRGDFTQAPTGTLAVNLGSKLVVNGTANLQGGTLEIAGADDGYVSNTHTEVLTADDGVTGAFDRLVKDEGVVFTSTTINYDANSVWLDTTGLDVTKAAAGPGVGYTAASMGSAQRVQGAFEQLNSRIATNDLDGVSNDFVRAAGQFQQARNPESAQASLRSLSGQLHAASAAMTFKAIDASSRALSDRFDQLLDGDGSLVGGNGFGMWVQNLRVGGDMGRAGFDNVGFQLDGWLAGSDRRIGQTGVAGYAFGRSRGQQRLARQFDHDNSRSTEGMMYAGWLSGNWYTQGRVGFGRFRQDVSRQLLLGDSTQGVRTFYDGSYDVASAESGLHFGRGGSHITPFVNVQYARIERDGFAEQGAGGFGLRSNAATVDRWQAGVGLRAGRHWNLDGGRSINLNARAQWQRTLASRGDVFDASFVGMPQWQPLVGIGLSRYSGLLGIGLDAALSARTTLKFGYDYETGQRDRAQTMSAHLNIAF